MIDFIAVFVVILIVGSAIVYIYKSKKKGVKCIGCPGGGCCNCNKEVKNVQKEP